MNKRILCSLVALALGAPLLAQAAEGWVVADISLQAGPDIDFPSLAELEAGTPVSIQGCIDGWTWCDVIVGNDEDRGWVPGTFIEEEVSGRPVVLIDAGPRIGVPIVSFSIGTYWDRHYHNRPFYTERQRFESHAIASHAPPRPATIVATAPRRDAHVRATAQSGGTATATQSAGTMTQQQRDRIAGMTGSGTKANTTRTTTTRQAGAQAATEQQNRRATSTAQTQTGTEPRDTSAPRRDTRTARQAPTDQRPSTEPSSDRRSAQTQAEPQPAKPSDATPHMKPHDEQPIAQKPQPREPQQQPTTVAQNEHARHESAQQQTQREQPKTKDELKKPEPKKDKDKQDNGGGGSR